MRDDERASNRTNAAYQDCLTPAPVIEIDLADLNQPVLCCPNDPDDAKLLSDVAGVKIDEVFIGA